jgi:hypothetical protein
MTTAALTLLMRRKEARLRELRELREQGFAYTAARQEVEILEKQLERIYQVIRSREKEQSHD